MFFSRIWFLLVTLLAVVLSVAFLLAPRPAEYRLDESLEKQLDTAQGLVDLHMQVQARRRLDVLSNIGKEPKITNPLLEIQSPEKKDSDTKESIQKLNKALKEANKKSGFNADTIAVMDLKGRVRARHGSGDKIDDNLRNLPEVKQALRGICLENTVKRNEKLYWVFACPVRQVKKGEKIKQTGVIRAEMPIDNDFVLSLASFIGASKSSEEEEKKEKKKDLDDSLDIELCFFADNRPVAWTKKTEIWRKHGPVLQKKHKELLEDKSIGRTPAETIDVDGKRFLIVLGRLPGSASGSGNFWAILWKYPTKLGPFAFLSGQTPRSHLLKEFPYVWVVLGSALALILGMFLLIWEGDLPTGRLLKQARALASGEQEKIADTKFRGKYSLIAIAINEALEKAAERSSGKPALHDKDLNEVLGELEPRMAEDDYAPPPLAKEEKPSGAKEPSPLGSVLPPEPKGSNTTTAAPPKPPPSPESSHPPFGGQKGIRPATIGEQQVSSSKAFGGESSVGSGKAPVPDGVSPDVEAHFKEVFNAFIKTKQDCGENVASLTYETFRKQLINSRKQIMNSQSSKEVKFEVYKKEGKAALKAHPVKS